MYTYLPVLLLATLRAHEAEQILDPYKVSRVIVLYVKQINILVYFSTGEPLSERSRVLFSSQ